MSWIWLAQRLDHREVGIRSCILLCIIGVLRLADTLLVVLLDRELLILLLCKDILRGLLRLPQLGLVQFIELPIGLIICSWHIASYICAVSLWSSISLALLLDQWGWEHTDVLYSLYLWLSVQFPVKDIVVRILLLQPFQKWFILLSNPLVLTVSVALIQTSIYWICTLSRTTSLVDLVNPLSWSGPWPVKTLLEVWNGWDVAFLVLGEIGTWASQNSSHLLKQDSISFLNLRASL